MASDSHSAKIHELAVNAVCPINQDPITVFEINMVKTLEEFGRQVVENVSDINAPNHSAAGVAESHAPAPSEPGDGGVAPTRSAPSGAPSAECVVVSLSTIQHLIGYWNGTANARAMKDALEHIIWELGTLAAAPSAVPAQNAEWKAAALRLGEQLATAGPVGYYDLTPTQWLNWCEHALSAQVPAARTTTKE